MFETDVTFEPGRVDYDVAQPREVWLWCSSDRALWLCVRKETAGFSAEIKLIGRERRGISHDDSVTVWIARSDR